MRTGIADTSLPSSETAEKRKTAFRLLNAHITPAISFPDWLYAPQTWH
jgi:hypothetical protein